MSSYRARSVWAAGAVPLSAATRIFAGFGGKPHLTDIACNGLMRHSTGAANHPIGIPYPTVSAGREFRPKMMLPNTIWLPNGKLSCVPCHQPYKKEHGKLALPNKRSSRCVQRHMI